MATSTQSLGIKAIAFTAYPVSDLKRARDFYENTLGLQPGGFASDFWQEYELGNGTFGIGMLPPDGPEYYRRPGGSLALEVDDLDRAVETLKQKGIPFVAGPNDFPNCRMVVIADPDNNVITLHQLKNSH